MELRDYKNRMGLLLRLAPYADLAKIRANLCAKIEAHMDNPRCRFSDSTKAQWLRFIDGEIHVAPSSFQAKNLLEHALNDSHPEYRFDAKRGQTYDEMMCYFFWNDDSLGLNDYHPPQEYYDPNEHEDEDEDDYDDYDDYDDHDEDQPF